MSRVGNEQCCVECESVPSAASETTYICVLHQSKLRETVFLDLYVYLHMLVVCTFPLITTDTPRFNCPFKRCVFYDDSSDKRRDCAQ